jgi:cell wall-associated NlpC family hydrolase
MRARHAGLKPRLHRALAPLSLAAAIAASSCASSGARPQPFPMPPAEAGPSPEAPSEPANSDRSFAYRDGYAIASAALRLQGIPYRSGGSDLHGFDCSGLVQYVLTQYGLAVPRVVRDQYEVGTGVRLDELEPGDLVFFTTEGRHVSHVGIAIGGDRFVHAPNARGTVRVDSLTSGYWGERVAGARRID